MMGTEDDPMSEEVTSQVCSHKRTATAALPPWLLLR